MNDFVVGIDIGGTNSVMGIVDINGNVLAKDSLNTPSHGDINKYIEDLSAVIKNLVSKTVTQNGRIVGIGIGAPNANYYKGTIEHAANLSFKGVVPFIDLLKKQFPDTYLMALTNDANAAALGEMIYGGAKGMKNFVLFTLGTGVGSGLVVNGDLVYGNDGFAGECGHTMLVPGGRVCGCGNNGHMEAYCSAQGMKRTAFELMVKYNANDSLLASKSFKELNSKDIYDAAVKGDKIAREVFEVTGKYLGISLADTIHHLSPEAVFLFGGPVAAGDLILKPTTESMELNLLPVFRNKIKVLPSKLNSGDAAILGASALVWKELEKNNI
jgi:glucokinase